ncbi:MAG TPA: hypothetical protein VNT79_19200 [Phycisphaerae bacterium]|nr:hypothetical protein [Phycisphaerae bacterium]
MSRCTKGCVIALGLTFTMGGICDGPAPKPQGGFECYRSCTDEHGATQFVRANNQGGEDQSAAIAACQNDGSGPCPAGTSDTGCNCFPPSDGRFILPDGDWLLPFSSEAD